jgi:hypothetical protein
VSDVDVDSAHLASIWKLLLVKHRCEDAEIQDGYHATDVKVFDAYLKTVCSKPTIICERLLDLLHGLPGRKC